MAQSDEIHSKKLLCSFKTE
ncbi:hypothetical protein AVEN_198665-1, partial [Araneus ventricosus]